MGGLPDDEDLGRRKLSSLPSRRRRVMDIVTRSRAVLELGAAKIRKMEDRPPPRLDDLTRTAKYQLFHKSLELVRRMASRRAIYADGVRMARVCMVDDFRLVAIEDLAGLATIKPVQLDRRAWKLSRSSERGLELCDSFMATLPRTRREPPPPVDHRPRTRHERARSWATVFTEEGAATWTLVDAMPEGLSFADRQLWEAELLGEPKATPTAQSTRPAPVPAPTMLRAAAVIYRRTRKGLAEAERTKAARLAETKGRVRDDGPALAARELDLHAELVEPLSDELAHVERLVIGAAVRVARVSAWPGRGPRAIRALNLAATMNADDDLHHAFAALGYAGIGETDNATT